MMIGNLEIHGLTRIIRNLEMLECLSFPCDILDKSLEEIDQQSTDAIDIVSFDSFNVLARRVQHMDEEAVFWPVYTDQHFYNLLFATRIAGRLDQLRKLVVPGFVDEGNVTSSTLDYSITTFMSQVNFNALQDLTLAVYRIDYDDISIREAADILTHVITCKSLSTIAMQNAEPVVAEEVILYLTRKDVPFILENTLKSDSVWEVLTNLSLREVTFSIDEMEKMLCRHSSSLRKLVLENFHVRKREISMSSKPEILFDLLDICRQNLSLTSFELSGTIRTGQNRWEYNICKAPSSEHSEHINLQQHMRDYVTKKGNFPVGLYGLLYVELLDHERRRCGECAATTNKSVQTIFDRAPDTISITKRMLGLSLAIEGAAMGLYASQLGWRVDQLREGDQADQIQIWSRILSSLEPMLSESRDVSDFKSLILYTLAAVRQIYEQVLIELMSEDGGDGRPQHELIDNCRKKVEAWKESDTLKDHLPDPHSRTFLVRDLDVEHIMDRILQSLKHLSDQYQIGWRVDQAFLSCRKPETPSWLTPLDELSPKLTCGWKLQKNFFEEYDILVASLRKGRR